MYVIVDVERDGSYNSDIDAVAIVASKTKVIDYINLWIKTFDIDTEDPDQLHDVISDCLDIWKVTDKKKVFVSVTVKEIRTQTFNLTENS